MCDHPFAEFEARVAGGTAPGCFVRLFDRTGVRAERGFGVVTPGGGLPDAGTVFRTASITKSVTACAVLMLRDAGRLTLDDPVRGWLPEIRLEAVEGAEGVEPTLRMLLSMSAGLPADDPWADRQESLTEAAFTRLLERGVRCAAQPGTGFMYSNLGYALLGRVIERAGGQPYREFVATKLLAPVGIDAGFERPPAAFAVGCRRAGDGWQTLPFSGPGAFSPIGGLFASAEALTGWVRWLDAAWLGRGESTLSAASRRELQQIHRFVPRDGAALGYGFGLYVGGGAAATVFHSGGYPGFSAHMRWHPATGMGIVAFENAGYTGIAEPAARVLREALGEAAAPPAPRPWPETLAAAAALTRLVQHWDDVAADAVFADNVALDESYALRRARIAAAVQQVGGLAGGAAVENPRAQSPADLVWRVSGVRGDLECDLMMTPQSPPRVQWFDVTVAED